MVSSYQSDISIKEGPIFGPWYVSGYNFHQGYYKAQKWCTKIRDFKSSYPTFRLFAKKSGSFTRDHRRIVGAKFNFYLVIPLSLN